MDVREGPLARNTLWLAMALVCAPAWSAGAQPATPPPEEDPRGPTAMRLENLADEQARSHFRIGQTLYTEGRFVDAANEFERAYALAHRPVLLFNAYLAHRDAGNLPRAIAALDQYLREEPNAEDAEVLGRRLRAMRATLAEQEAAAAASQAERDRLAEESRRLAEEAAYHRDRAATAEARARENRSPVPFIVGGAGLGVLIGSGISAIIANGRISDLDALCPDGFCPPNVDLGEERAQVRRPAIATDVMLGIGTAGVVVGLVLLATRGSDEEEAPPVSATASCVRGGCNVIVGGSF
jgi:hypothetical protein